jgi:hypothetical protein
MEDNLSWILFIHESEGDGVTNDLIILTRYRMLSPHRTIIRPSVGFRLECF